MNCRLNGISFAELPHISNGESVIVVREKGREWDSEARPAYSVRLEGLHVGYIPLIETLMEEKLKARDGYKKVWKAEFEALSKEELRRVAKELNESGELAEMHDWKFIGKEKAKPIVQRKDKEIENTYVIRDWLYVEIMRNHLVPRATVAPVYYDEKEGRNLDEIGDICSLSVRFDIW
jgi:hypothetical protein